MKREIHQMFTTVCPVVGQHAAIRLPPRSLPYGRVDCRPRTFRTPPPTSAPKRSPHNFVRGIATPLQTHLVRSKNQAVNRKNSRNAGGLLKKSLNFRRRSNCESIEFGVTSLQASVQIAQALGISYDDLQNGDTEFPPSLHFQL